MDFGKILDNFVKHKTDVTGFDIGHSDIKAVRMHRTGESLSISAAHIIPLPHNENEPQESTENEIPNSLNLELPAEIKAQYGCIATPGENAIIKLLSFPGKPDDKITDKVINSMGIKNLDDYRLNYKITSSGDAHNESHILAAALPENEARQAMTLFSTGIPAPLTLEISGLATISAFLNGPATRHKSEVIGVIEFGDNISTFALFNKNNLSLLRRFNFGTAKIISQIMKTLGIDNKTATDILDEGSFDISMVTNELLVPIANQLAVSRDFIERRENCNVSCLYIIGELANTASTADIIREAMHIDIHTWLPTENITVEENAFSPELENQQWKFSAAIGACLATLEK